MLNGSDLLASPAAWHWFAQVGIWSDVKFGFFLPLSTFDRQVGPYQLSYFLRGTFEESCQVLCFYHPPNSLLLAEWRRSTLGWKHTIIFCFPKPFQDNVSTMLMGCMKFAIYSLPTNFHGWEQRKNLLGFRLPQNKLFFSLTLYLALNLLFSTYFFILWLLLLQSWIYFLLHDLKNTHLATTTQQINWCSLMGLSIFFYLH